MNNTDRLVRNLINALDAIAREAKRENAHVAYIQGAAEHAIKSAESKMVRNADGYLVVAEDVK